MQSGSISVHTVQGKDWNDVHEQYGALLKRELPFHSIMSQSQSEIVLADGTHKCTVMVVIAKEDSGYQPGGMAHKR